MNPGALVAAYPAITYSHEVETICLMIIGRVFN